MITNYWENRYKTGGTSGAGSEGESAIRKAEFVNRYVVGSVLDIGCGDGQQAQLYDFEDYLGIDISEKALDLARERNPSKAFQLETNEPRDTHLSMDVMFHQVTEEAFQGHLDLLFSAKKRVIVYSSNHDQKGAPHVLHRKWTERIPKGWKLVAGGTGMDKKEFFVLDRE